MYASSSRDSTGKVASTTLATSPRRWFRSALKSGAGDALSGDLASAEMTGHGAASITVT